MLFQKRIDRAMRYQKERNEAAELKKPTEEDKDAVSKKDLVCDDPVCHAGDPAGRNFGSAWHCVWLLLSLLPLICFICKTPRHAQHAGAFNVSQIIPLIKKQKFEKQKLPCAENEAGEPCFFHTART